MALLSAGSGTVGSDELQLAVSESLRSLNDMGVAVSLSGGVKHQLSPDSALSAYSLFEELIEGALPGLKGVNAAFTENGLKLSLEGTERLQRDTEDITGASAFEEDGVLYVRIPLAEGGGSL